VEYVRLTDELCEKLSGQISRKILNAYNYLPLKTFEECGVDVSEELFYTYLKGYHVFNEEYICIKEISKLAIKDNINYKVEDNHITELDISDNSLTVIPDSLGTFPYLKKLDLSYNRITEISGLLNLSNLEKLNLSVNNIAEIKGIKSLVNLKEFSIYYNQISEIKGLDNLTNLQYLSLHGNQISEIKGLENFTNLKYLSLSYNQIKDIKNLENLTKLKHLYLFKNEIEHSKIETLQKKLPYCMVLYL